MAVEVRALFDREGHVMDIGFDVTGGLQGNRLRADDTQDCATHDHLLTRDHPRHPPLLTDEDLGRLNVTLNVAIDLQHAPANDPQPLTMIVRSLPMTDFSPLDGGVSDRLAGDWVFGSTEALRVNMKSPDDLYTSPPDCC